jgi:hypothetical protein
MLTAAEAAALREAADYLRGQSYTARDRWTKAEVCRLAEQLDAVLADQAAQAILARGQLPLEL